MLLTVPLLVDEPFYDLTIDFDGVEYNLTFLYNQRLDHWCMSILDASGAEIVKGILLVCEFSLLMTYRDARLPRGMLVCRSSIESDTSPPGLSELGPGRRCELYYVTADDEIFQ